MKYKNIIGQFFLLAVAVLYPNFVHNLGHLAYNDHPKVLGVATTTDPSTLAHKISKQFENLEQKNADLQTALDRQKFLALFPRNLKRGMTGQDVTTLQNDLNQTDSLTSNIIVTGRFNKATEVSLKEFQKNENLQVTGIFNLASKEKLAKLIVTETERDQIDIESSLQDLLDSQQTNNQTQVSETIAPTASSTVLGNNEPQDCPSTDTTPADYTAQPTPAPVTTTPATTQPSTKTPTTTQPSIKPAPITTTPKASSTPTQAPVPKPISTPTSTQTSVKK
jgi:hypothetical protein